jgi:sterol desaturase/sphingolipid hydroxylase (fatty acid hydroxylase superfamily)
VTWDEALLPWVKPTVLTVGMVVLWTWESALPFFERPRGRWCHAGRNLSVALLNTVLIGLLFGAATVAIATWAESRRVGLLHQWEVFPSIKLIAAVLLLDGWLYLWHRANHVIPFLWRFHRMHHADPAMDVTTALRFHLGELTMSAVLRLGLIPLLGLTPVQMLLHETCVVAVTMFHHANISVGACDRWLRLCIVTPFVHKVHHSREWQETNSNYSTVFSWWDRLGGTFRQRDDYAAIQYGLREFEDPSWDTVMGMLSIPWSRRPTPKPQGDEEARNSTAMRSTKADSLPDQHS